MDPSIQNTFDGCNRIPGCDEDGFDESEAGRDLAREYAGLLHAINAETADDLHGPEYVNAFMEWAEWLTEGDLPHNFSPKELATHLARNPLTRIVMLDPHHFCMCWPVDETPRKWEIALEAANVSMADAPAEFVEEIKTIIADYIVKPPGKHCPIEGFGTGWFGPPPPTLTPEQAYLAAEDAERSEAAFLGSPIHRTPYTVKRKVTSIWH